VVLHNWAFGKTEGPPWPNGDDGKPVPPVFLTHVREVALEGQIVMNMLTSAGIPVLKEYPNDGAFGKVIIGLSGTGLELYVPETMAEDAKALISEDFEEAEDVQG